jgi:hypothetical protein
MSASTISSTLGILLTRLAVPGWLLTGALFKLYYRSPRSLPETIWRNADDMGINLDLLLRGIIGLELIIAGIMFFSRRFSRTVAIALLALFCLILLNEMRIGAASCGCMGTIVMPPWLMLIIDLPLLIGVLIFKPRPPEGRPEVASKESKRAMNPWPAVLALAWVLISVGLVFGVPEVKVQQPVDDVAMNSNQGGDSSGNAPDTTGHPNTPGAPGAQDQNNQRDDRAADPSDGGGGSGASPNSPPKPDRRPLPPPSYHVFKVDEYAGKRWDELPFTRFLRTQPKDIDSGRRYVVLYNPTCDHCFELLMMYFADDLPVPTTVIAIPEMKTGWSDEEAYPMPCETCERLELPLGCDWLVLPPVVIALEDGIVQCAKEGEEPDEPECLLWH